MARGEMRLIAAVCLLMTGCGSFHHLTGNASAPRVSTLETASAARIASGARVASECPAAPLPLSFPASPTSTRNLVIAKLLGSDQTVIRDVTDIDHPATVATLDVAGWGGAGWGGDGWGSPSFVSPSTISYLGDARRLMRSPVTGSGAQVLLTACGSATIVAFSWSPDGQSFTFVLEPADESAHIFEWHLVSLGVDRLIGLAPAWCHCGNGSEDTSLDVGFSPDGHRVSLVDSFWNGTNLQVRSLDGSLVGAEVRGDLSQQNPVTMGVWSGTDLFFRDLKGVERWRGGTIVQFLPGVSWLHPRASPAGGQIVYAVRGGDGLAHINLVDTASGLSRQLSSQPRTLPMFLNSRYIWYRGERLCASNEPGMCIKTTLTGKTYIYDLQTGTEWESIITNIADVWPHGA